MSATQAMTPEQRARLENVARLYPFVRLRNDDIAAALAHIDALEAQNDTLTAERDALLAELRQACLCRWKSVDGDIRLRHECDAHKAERLGRNAALEREQKERAAKEQAERTAAALQRRVTALEAAMNPQDVADVDAALAPTKEEA